MTWCGRRVKDIEKRRQHPLKLVVGWVKNIKGVDDDRIGYKFMHFVFRS